MKSGKDGCHTTHGTAASVRSSDADAGVELRWQTEQLGFDSLPGGELGTLKQPWRDLGERVEEERKRRVRWQALSVFAI